MQNFYYLCFQNTNKMIRKTLISSAVLCFSIHFSIAQLTEKERFDISKNLDIFNSIYKELCLYYVDSIAFEDIIRENIDFMLRRIDPYTEYIPEEDMPNFLLQTTGEYGGIGAIITSDSNNVFVSEPYEGLPAALSGLQAGDILIEIDGENLTGKTSSFASERLKGQPNTAVKIKFQRRGEKKPREIEITRRRIEIDPVTYFGVLPENTGYIYLSSFTTHSARSVGMALDSLKKQNIKSLIIDVRDNGGGVVEDCLEMLNLFVPKGKVLLSMRSKAPQPNRIYRAGRDAVDTEIPLAVLVNRQSASASEIFAGALQDLDRAVIVGTRTYGKGLVQSSRPLPYNGQLKLTTAKYYIPSGRCIQAIDYSNRNDDGSASQVPDSLTSVFYTEGGREVRDGGGITPDITVEHKKLPTMLYYLDGRNIFFDFVVEWRQKHPKIASPEIFSVDENIWQSFTDFVKARNFSYDRQSEKALAGLKEIMDFEGYLATASNEIKALEAKLHPNLDRDLSLQRDLISDFLSREIMRQYYYAKGEIIYSLKNDDDVRKAIEVLQKN
jgi:carboxyl-terminal processing protease